MKKNYYSELLKESHKSMEGLCKPGMLDKKTMREFDELCLTPVRPLTGEEIRHLREREGFPSPCWHGI